MAATVTPLLTLIDNCDAVGTWSGAPVVDSTVQLQGTGCLSKKVSSSVLTFTTAVAATNMTATHIFVWMLCTTTGKLDTVANGGMRIRVEDASANFKEWYVGGVDNYPGAWKNFVVDTASAHQNASATLPNMAAITRVGVGYKMAINVQGNITNCFWDVIRYGSGLQITAGTDGAPGTFTDIITEENANYYGVLRREGGINYCSGELIFGSTTAGVSTVFSDKNQVIVFEDKPVNASLYKIKVQGNATASTKFILGEKVGTGAASLSANPVIFRSANHRFLMDFANSNITELKLYGTQIDKAGFVNIGGSGIALNGTGVELIETATSNSNTLTRNISGSPLILRNKISSNISTTAAMQVLDTLNVDASRFSVVTSYGFTSVNNSVVETLQIKDMDFTSNTQYVLVYAKKTWDMVNPTWNVVTTTQNQLKFFVNDANKVNEKFSMDLTVQAASGAAISAARTYIYEGLVNKNLPVVVSSDVSGAVSSNILKREFTYATATTLNSTTYGSFALKVYKYGRTPYTSALTVTKAISQPVVIPIDTAIVAASAATALTNGSGITVTRGTNTSTLLNYASGTVSFAVGNIVTGATSGATGTVVEITEGTTSSGKVFLKSRNATAFQSGENLQVSGSTRAVAGTSLNYRWEVNCNSLSLSVVYDYLSAKMEQSPADAVILDAIKWGADEQSQLLYVGTSGYFTERNSVLAEGVFVSNRGSGTIASMRSDSGTQYIPPVQFSFSLTGLQPNTEVRLFKVSDQSEVAGVENSGTSYSYNYVYAGDIEVYVVIHHVDYEQVYLPSITLSNTSQSIPVQQRFDRTYLNQS